MQTNRHPNSLRNLELTPEERQRNIEKITATTRATAGKKNQALLERIAAAGMEDKSSRVVADLLGVTKYQVLRARRWHKAREEV